ncbi:MAG: hypothetical protein ATN36_00205 [Epulopiscium sp. Nele67-Bin005]|nr:MAG: hypothetical protein ATN36_00205 [Epulopiscium sp. Nele67-Bin005]
MLSLKDNIEQVKKKELSDAFAFKQQKVDEKEALENTYKLLEEQMKAELTSGKINPTVMEQLGTYKKLVAAKIVEAQKAVDKAHELVLKAQENLREAVKERKILETLKEKHIEAQMTLERQAEQILLDEIVSYKYITKEGGS